MSNLCPISHFPSPVSCDLLVSQGLRCEWRAGMLNLEFSHTLSHWSLEVQRRTSWQQALWGGEGGVREGWGKGGGGPVALTGLLPLRNQPHHGRPARSSWITGTVPCGQNQLLWFRRSPACVARSTKTTTHTPPHPPPQPHLKDDRCLDKGTGVKGDGLVKQISSPKPYWNIGHHQLEDGGEQAPRCPPAPSWRTGRGSQWRPMKLLWTQRPGGFQEAVLENNGGHNNLNTYFGQHLEHFTLRDVLTLGASS